jgi:hypothetical protein
MVKELRLERDNLCKSLVIKRLDYMRSFMFIAKIGYDLLPFISFVAKIEHVEIVMY